MEALALSRLLRKACKKAQTISFGEVLPAQIIEANEEVTKWQRRL